jgi:hypothetical protein
MLQGVSYSSAIRTRSVNLFILSALGDRKYKIPRMDPLEISEMVISEGPSQGGYSLTMRNIKMHGLKDAVIQKTE